MSAKYDGGPAFPTEQHETQNGGWNQTYEQGMTMRDYFAAKAMQGLLSQSMGTAPSSSVKFGAEYAYQMADAMLAERAK
jgi:hypothetical protein